MSEAQAARAVAPMIRDLLRFLTVLAGISRLLVEGCSSRRRILIRPICRGNTLAHGKFAFLGCSGRTTVVARLRRTRGRRNGVDEEAPQKGTVTQRAIE